MEIIIGRNAQNGQLNLLSGNKTGVYGAANSVPRSVSRRHCRIEVLPNGTYSVENLKMENDTYVNGIAVFKKTVTTSDVIELGGEHYKLDWDAVQKFVQSLVPPPPKTCDIRPLKRIWMQYEEETNAIQSNMAKKNAIRSVAGALGTLGMISFFILPEDLGFFRVFFMVIGFIITLAMVVIALNDSKKAPIKKKMLQQKLRDNYVCPNCKKFFNMDYDLLTRQYDNCPYCKAKFIK
jgi:DNA-directed RNA polymerase subunit RPC12/RpoP